MMKTTFQFSWLLLFAVWLLPLNLAESRHWRGPARGGGEGGTRDAPNARGLSSNSPTEVTSAHCGTWLEGKLIMNDDITCDSVGGISAFELVEGAELNCNDHKITLEGYWEFGVWMYSNTKLVNCHVTGAADGAGIEASGGGIRIVDSTANSNVGGGIWAHAQDGSIVLRNVEANENGDHGLVLGGTCSLNNVVACNNGSDDDIWLTYDSDPTKWNNVQCDDISMPTEYDFECDPCPGVR